MDHFIGSGTAAGDKYELKCPNSCPITERSSSKLNNRISGRDKNRASPFKVILSLTKLIFAAVT